MMRHLRNLAVLSVAGVLAASAPAAAQTFFTYHCGDGSEFIAAFYEGDKRAHLQLDGKAITLSKRISLRGSRYVRGDITLRIAKSGVTLKHGRRTTTCSAD